MTADRFSARDATLAEVARLAARLCGTPMAFVGLAGPQGLEVLAATGLDPAAGAGSTLAEVAQGTDLLIVESIAAHPVLADGPLARAGVRSLAATPLPDIACGEAGVLCVGGHAPVDIGDRRLESLRMLAGHAARALSVPNRLAWLEQGNAVGGLAADEGIGEAQSDWQTGEITLSPSLRRLLAVTDERVARDQVLPAIFPDGSSHTQLVIESIRTGAPPPSWVTRVTAHDGRVRWLQVHIALDPARCGDRPPLLHCVVVDLTERRLLESLADELTARTEAQADLENLIDHMAVATATVTPDGRVVSANRAMAELAGMPAAALRDSQAMAQRWADDPETQTRLARAIDRAMRGEVAEFEGVAHMPYGERWLRLIASPVLDTDGAVRHIVVNGFDTTERHLAEKMQMMEESYRQLQAVMDGSPSAIFAKDRDGRYVFANRAVAHNLGLPLADVFGRTASDISVYRDFEPLSAEDRRVLDLGETVVEEVSARGPDGEWRHYSIQKFPLRDADGEVHAICGIATDIGERKAMDAERQRRSEQQALIGALTRSVAEDPAAPGLGTEAARAARQGVNAAGAIVVAVTPDGTVDVTGVHGLDHEDDAGRGLTAATTAMQRSAAVVGSGAIAIPVLGHARAEGAVVVLPAPEHPLDAGDRHFVEEIARVLAVARARERADSLEAELAQANRLQAVGRLAGGVAHDFNNLLAVIMNYASFVAEALGPEDATVREDVAEIVAAAERASDLTRRLLLFGRDRGGAGATCRPDEVIAALDRRLRETVGPGVAIERSLGAPGATVAVPGEELEQVVVSLAVNAREATDGRGTLRIATTRHETGVGIVVSDDGRGMAAEVAERAFDPFFTTSGPGESSGMGLATVHGTVRRADGRIELASAPGEGTTVSIYLPAAPRPRSALSTAGGATVLLVDDQPAVREAARRILEGGGYRVVATAGAEDARAVLQSRSGGIDLLLADVVMPGESGPELAASVPEFAAGHPVLFMSGYADDVIGRHADLPGTSALLEKPFTRQSLLDAVGTALAAGPGDRGAPSRQTG